MAQAREPADDRLLRQLGAAKMEKEAASGLRQLEDLTIDFGNALSRGMWQQQEQK